MTAPPPPTVDHAWIATLAAAVARNSAKDVSLPIGHLLGACTVPNCRFPHTYRFDIPGTRPRAARTPPSETDLPITPQLFRRAQVPDWALKLSIVHALIRAPFTPLPLIDQALPRPTEPDPKSVIAHARLAEAERRLADLDSDRRRTREAAKRAELNGRHNTAQDLDDHLGQLVLAAKELTETVTRLRAEAGSATSKPDLAGQDPHGANIRSIIEFVASLRDPHDRVWAATLRKSLHDLRFTVTPLTLGGLEGGWQVEWEGSFLLTDDDRTARLPIIGRFTCDAISRTRDWADTMYVQMRDDGTTLSAALGTPGNRRDKTRMKYVDAVAERLGDPKEICQPIRIEDERLLRLTLAVVYPNGRRSVAAASDNDVLWRRGQQWQRIQHDPLHAPQFRGALGQRLTALGHALGEPAALLCRIAFEHGMHPNRQWTIKPNPRLAHVLIVAAMNHGRASVDACNALATRSGIGAMSPSLWNARMHGRRDLADQLSYSKQSGWAAPECSHCGSVRRTAYTLREVSGLGCLDCHRDQAGVHWLPAQYDRFLMCAEVWTARGLVDGAATSRHGSTP